MWLLFSLCTFVAGFSRVCSCFIWRLHLNAHGRSTDIGVAEGRVWRSMAKVCAGKWRWLQIQHLNWNQPQNFWRQMEKWVMRIPQKYSQTNKHHALHPRVLLLFFLAGHHCYRISTCLLPARPETQLQKIPKLRETFLCSHLHFSPLKLLFHKKGGKICNERQILRSSPGQLTVTQQHRHSDHDYYDFTF